MGTYGQRPDLVRAQRGGDRGGVEQFVVADHAVGPGGGGEVADFLEGELPFAPGQNPPALVVHTKGDGHHNPRFPRAV